MEKSRIHSNLKRIRQINPIVYCLTAAHEANITANGLLALGAEPVFNMQLDEAEENMKQEKAVILKMDMAKEHVENLLSAGKSAAKSNIPIILDSSGAGLSILRKQESWQILKDMRVAIIHGNTADIACLIGEKWDTPAENKNFLNHNECELALLAAKRLSSTIVMSGKEQVVSDGISTFSVHNHTPLMRKVAGSSNLLSAIIAAAAAVGENELEAALSALLFNGVAAELAANKTEGQGVGSFQIEFINQLSLISPAELALSASFTKYDV